MNIGFEAKRFFTNYTGLGNYSRFIIDAISRTYPENQYALFSPRVVDHQESRDILKRKNVSVIAPSGISAMPLFSAIWRTWGMTRSAAARRLDLFHGLSQELPLGLPSGAKKVVTVHDLIFLRYPQFYNAVDVSIYTRKVRHACENADRIIAISHQSADDIRTFLSIEDPSRISVVYQGCHPIFNTVSDDAQRSAVRKKYALPPRYILSVGTVEERKNLLLLVHALARLPKKSKLPLVVVGRHTSYFNQVLDVVTKTGQEHDIIFLTGVDFQDLPAIYQQSEVFVYPSLFEGFGIPLIEAITSGVPVITSVGSCFQEAAGPGARYVETDNPDALANQIEMLLSDVELRTSIVSAGKNYIKQFEPAVIAENLNSVYRDITR